MKKRPVALTAFAAVLALALTACSDDSADSGGDESSAAAISHIHGVGIDPADGKLYVATHQGIYTPDKNGKPRLVGDRKDDFMGFTVTKAGTFVASGHPAPGRDAPSNLGLIESTDAGKTWKDKSLSGDVDFHALDYADGTLYGYDSTNGLVRASKDGVKWEKRGTLQALDIAVAPKDANDADTVLATTEQGVARSTNGGKTFQNGKAAVMAFVSWPAPDALYGIDPSGALNLSRDAGRSWKKVSTIPGGQPQALTAVDAKHVIAATQSGVYESKDGGRTFTKRLAVASGDEH
ncbi:F510_1955 family glycosylhydrolase [Streptomyces sp. NPDC050315]|uniref:F510_1955 family glycosylhydrolase n=1 Tax=Streptomyces sp. NPDC050315 TaxID=3155039 RepID=UPI00343D1480